MNRCYCCRATARKLLVHTSWKTDQLPPCSGRNPYALLSQDETHCRNAFGTFFDTANVNDLLKHHFDGSAAIYN